MEKKRFSGIQMEVTRYNASKDLMRRGLKEAIELGKVADNATQMINEAIEKVNAYGRLAAERRCAGFWIG